MWEELGVSSGTAIIILIALYFVIKWAVKNGIKDAYRDITEKKLQLIGDQNLVSFFICKIYHIIIT